MLGRVANGPRAAQFPEIAKMFGKTATRDDQNECLKRFIQNGSNLKACEATFKATKEVETNAHSGMEQITLKDMRDRGYTANLICN